MPSGFQQDQNQLTPSYYRVVISCGSGSAEWYTVGNGDGVESEGRISTYSWDNFSNGDLPSTQAVANALARGNLRFQYIVEAIENLADCQILDIEHAANPNADDMADNSSIAFTVKFDRDEGVLPALMAIKKAQGWSSDGTISYDNVTYPAYYVYAGTGNTVNSPDQAIRDVIWLALKQYDPYTDSNVVRKRSTRVYHENTGGGYQDIIETAHPWNNDSDAWSDISVNEINGTTTTITAD